MRTLRRVGALGLLSGVLLTGCESMKGHEASPLMQHGSMHEVIGQRRHEGRVALSEIARDEHVYAVGALAGLRGEITIADSVVTVSSVGPDGSIQPHDDPDSEAALLVGQSVPRWQTIAVAEDVSHDAFDEWITRSVAEAGLAHEAPLVFAIAGEFSGVHLHVINGACPVHARIKNLTIDPANEPYVLDSERVLGTVVGVFAPDAVGKLTHPATSTHSHLVFIDATSGERVTGHLERVGVFAGSTLLLPMLR